MGTGEGDLPMNRTAVTNHLLSAIKLSCSPADHPVECAQVPLTAAGSGGALPVGQMRESEGEFLST